MKELSRTLINIARKAKSNFSSRKAFKNFVYPGVTIYHSTKLGHLQQIINPIELELFVSSVKDLNPVLIVDVGAYVGFFSAVAEKYCKSTKIFAVEPNFRNYQLLLKTIAHTGNPNITCVFAAASDQSSIMPLYGADQGSSLNAFWGGRQSENYIQHFVQVISLSQIIPKRNFLGNVIIKLDAEGCEFQIISELLDTLSNCKHVHIFAEISLYKNQLNVNDKFIEVFQLLMNAGFKAFPISNTQTPLSLSVIKKNVSKAKIDRSEPFSDIEFLFTK